jgi:putative ABC transport system substrate-binding protein
MLTIRGDRVIPAPRALLFAVLLVAAMACTEALAAHLLIGTLAPPDIVLPEAGLREGLTSLGYVEGSNLTIQSKRGDSSEAFRSAAASLIKDSVTVIVAFGSSAARAALAVTSEVPVVFISGDPLGTGLVPSLARPGANATGISTVNTELIPKRFQLLQEVLPATRRILLLSNPNSPLHSQELKNARAGAAALQLDIVLLTARNPEELEAVLAKIRRGQADGFTTSSDALFLSSKSKIAEAVGRAKLPAIFPWPNDHDPNVLMAYGASTKEMGLRAAGYVDKIFKGAKPGDLPIEQISKYELIVDLRAAKALGIRVPQELIMRADQVVR